MLELQAESCISRSKEKKENGQAMQTKLFLSTKKVQVGEEKDQTTTTSSHISKVEIICINLKKNKSHRIN